ncbi:MAG TPA: glutamate--tRNA ligase [Hyphomonadaceae bacterium]|nr:glutamate--tRNA ligase [Hyphomonadaceae bacterium]
MSIRLRFAPSPTGRLHVGNVRTALMNWLFALREGGQVLLRIDDTDLARSTKEFEQGIEDDLTWLGLKWHERANQSHRFDVYEKAAEGLKAAGLLYPCYETEEELDRKRKIAQATGKPPVYDRAALKLTQAERAKLEAEGRKPHWRFKLSGARKDWVDLVRGPQSIDTASLSDPVLIREDGAFLYTLPSVVDDVEFKITHIVRGEDHVTNSGVQIEIFEALGGEVPAFGHFPLLVGADGSALSKRIGSLGVGELAADGYEPVAILSHLAKIGTSDPVEARLSIDQLAEEFAFEKIGRAPARFDPEELKRVNAAVLHQLGYIAVEPRLAQFGAAKGEAFWSAVRANLVLLPDVKEWVRIVEGPIEPVVADPAFASVAAELLPKGAYDASSWSAFTNAVKEKTGAKGKALFMPLRQALTGMDHGPEMAALFPLIGEERARKRLQGMAA